MAPTNRDGELEEQASWPHERHGHGRKRGGIIGFLNNDDVESLIESFPSSRGGVVGFSWAQYHRLIRGIALASRD